MSSIIPAPKVQFLDRNGKPLAGCSVYYYVPNTTTPKNTYQDQSLTILNPNPVILDARGEASIWGEGAYRVILQDAFGATIYDQLTTALASTADFNSIVNQLKTDLSATTAPSGATLIGVLLGGNVQGAIPWVSVDNFGADPTGLTDSTAAFIAAAQALTGATDSAYVTGATAYGQVIMGRGTYMIGDVPFFTGVWYVGQGPFATRIKPKPGAGYCFTTTGTSTSTGGAALARLFCAGLSECSVGCAYYETLGTIPTGVGGVNLAYASYIALSNVYFRRLDGRALLGQELWDSDFTNVRIMYCGNNTDTSNPVPGLELNKGAGSDGCNALRFRGLHIEACPKSMHLDIGCRHVFFTSPKIESGTVSSTIVGAQGVTFDCAELSWFSSTIPQFDISRTTTYDSFGVVFEAPTLISNSNRGWYFRHSSNAGSLVLNSPVFRQIATLVTGNNVIISGGSGYDSGPMLVNCTGLTMIDGIDWIAIKPVVAADGTDDAIILNGLGNSVINVQMQSAGSITDGGAFINIGPTASDIVAHDLRFQGARQIGVRNSYTPAWIRDVRTVNNGTLASLVTPAPTRYTLTNLNATGFGTGGVDSANATVAVNATASLPIIAGASLMVIRAQSSTLSFPSALIFADANNATAILLGAPGDVFRVGSGSAGDGHLYITISAGNLNITNRTAVSVTVYAASVSAVS